MEELKSHLNNFVYGEDLDSFKGTNKPGKETDTDNVIIDNKKITRFTNEFWTSKQRQANSIHEISYRACYKPQLPRFFINRLTEPEDVVYDPFAGRGTTAVEAGLLSRNIITNDINPLSAILVKPRFFIPALNEINKRLDRIPWDHHERADIDLSMFYHKRTEGELVSLRKYLRSRLKDEEEDNLDRWIRMVATNRLTGHSRGFFSVYTLPPNQAVSQESQRKINEKRNQKPKYRDVKTRIIKKSKSLSRDITKKHVCVLEEVGEKGLFLTDDARHTSIIKNNSISLTVTSPPFLNVVQYSKDNWLRCWFNSIDVAEVERKITMAKTIEKWSEVMGDVFKELFRITKEGGWVAFEVGEVRNGRVNLDEHVVPLGENTGFTCPGILINSQEFTKTSNIWGVDNKNKGTNTNRVVLLYKGKNDE